MERAKVWKTILAAVGLLFVVVCGPEVVPPTWNLGADVSGRIFYLSNHPLVLAAIFPLALALGGETIGMSWDLIILAITSLSVGCYWCDPSLRPYLAAAAPYSLALIIPAVIVFGRRLIISPRKS